MNLQQLAYRRVNLVEWRISIAIMSRVVRSSLSLVDSGRNIIVD